MSGLTPRMQVPAPQQADPKEALLAQLHELQMPEPIGWWPPAPGWWVLAGLVIIALTLGIYQGLKYYRQRRYRAQALAELTQIQQQRQAMSTAHYTLALMTLLKRTFFSAYPNSRRYVAGLRGAAWLTLLQQTLPAKAATQDLGDAVDAMLYRREEDHSDPAALQVFVRTWISKHRQNSAAIQRMIRSAGEHNPDPLQAQTDERTYAEL